MAWMKSLQAATRKIDVPYLLAGVAILAVILLATQTANSPVLTGTDNIAVLLTVDAGGEVDASQLMVTNNTTAFDVLDRNHEVTYQESSYGYFITGIDGVTMNDTHSWIYFVNGEPPSVGAGNYILSKGDNVTFQFLSNEESKAYFE